ncbi:phosphoglycerate dehydrogenase [Opitutales bacterium]|nr:phosphoglycerate dehydrogenase [Opitutales bacterium]MDA8805785.1 phosphoglycerate dehydrogenase [Opitutales bacterium]
MPAKKSILITTTSFQDVPGIHHDLLDREGYQLIRQRGPLCENAMLDLVGEVDGMICGDDAITPAVIDKALPRLQVISKYGIGLDKIDVDYVTKQRIPLTFCPGVNHTTVAEHTFTLLLSLCKNLVPQANDCAHGLWNRRTGHEIFGKRILILGMGRIGKEVAIRARAFGMEVSGYNRSWDDSFAQTHQISRVTDIEEALPHTDMVSLHLPFTESTHNLINPDRLALLPKGAFVINTGRGELVNAQAVVDALESGHLGGYGADVLDQEPPPNDHPLLGAPRCVITPHIGSRTYESVGRQAEKAARNLILAMNGQQPLAQANQVPIPQPPSN